MKGDREWNGINLGGSRGNNSQLSIKRKSAYNMGDGHTEYERQFL